MSAKKKRIKSKKVKKNNWMVIQPSVETPLTAPYLTAPPLISPKAKKILGFFLVKDLFFSIGKKGRGLTAPPYFREKCSEGGGAVRGVSTDSEGVVRNSNVTAYYYKKCISKPNTRWCRILLEKM